MLINVALLLSGRVLKNTPDAKVLPLDQALHKAISVELRPT